MVLKLGFTAAVRVRKYVVWLAERTLISSSVISRTLLYDSFTLLPSGWVGDEMNYSCRAAGDDDFNDSSSSEEDDEPDEADTATNNKKKIQPRVHKCLDKT